jgi:hypothetical protein
LLLVGASDRSSIALRLRHVFSIIGRGRYSEWPDAVPEVVPFPHSDQKTNEI